MTKNKKLIKFSKETSNNKILEYIKSDNKVTRIIGLFMRAKKMVIENNIQMSRIYARNVKAAKELDCYSDKRIIKTIKYLIDKADYKWTIESISKHIDENFEILEGKKPIIVLSNGENIYSVERIRQLERNGKIYYTGSRWKEVF